MAPLRNFPKFGSPAGIDVATLPQPCQPSNAAKARSGTREEFTEEATKMEATVTKMIEQGRVPNKLRGREVRKHRGDVRGAHRLHPLDKRRAAELTR